MLKGENGWGKDAAGMRFTQHPDWEPQCGSILLYIISLKKSEFGLQSLLGQM